MFWSFGPEVCGILAPWPGIEPAPPTLEDEVLTTGPPGKSQDIYDSYKKKKKKKTVHIGFNSTLDHWKLLKQKLLQMLGKHG